MYCFIQTLPLQSSQSSASFPRLPYTLAYLPERRVNNANSHHFQDSTMHPEKRAFAPEKYQRPSQIPPILDLSCCCNKFLHQILLQEQYRKLFHLPSVSHARSFS